MNRLQINSDEALEAKHLYKKVGALRDLLETINYHPEKEYLREQIKKKLACGEQDINNWWNRMSDTYNRQFSDEARINFDDAYIDDE